MLQVTNIEIIQWDIFPLKNVVNDSFIKLLKGEISPKGRLPVKVSDEFPLGSGIVY